MNVNTTKEAQLAGYCVSCNPNYPDSDDMVI